MNPKSTICFILFLSSVLTGSSQSRIDIVKNLKWQNRYAEKENGLIQIAIDTITSDSIYIDKDEFKRINPRGELIEYLKIQEANLCNDTGYKLSGRYQQFYKSGKLHKTGKLKCGMKTGEWFEFYEKGNIKNYSHYLGLEQAEPVSLQQGLYKEYFQNGQTKIRGQYQVFESFESFTLFDYETYEERDSCCSWQLISMKTSNWLEYDSTGTILNETNYKVELNDKKLRDYSDKLKRIDNK